jgi:hypothetical protein
MHPSARRIVATNARAGSGRRVLTLATIAAALFAAVAGAQPVELPIVERPHEHEAALGYTPWYVPNVPAFDKFNRPYIRSRTVDPHETGFIQTLRNGRWVQRDFLATVRAAYPTFAKIRHGGGTLGACITFDSDDCLYTLIRIRLQDNSDRDLLVYSIDYGDTFQLCELPNDEPLGAKPEGFANMEFRVGSNRLTRPPLITTLRKRADHPLGQWTAHYNMYLLQPRKADGRITLSEPVLVTDHGLYMSRHAGNPSFAVSGPDKTYFTWAETTENNYVPGAPTFIATFDPQSLSISDRRFCAFAYPPNDGHNSPGIVLDTDGFLHVITGGHGESFMYSRSLAPYSTAGMSEAAPVVTRGWSEFGTDRGRQSYLSFVSTSDGTLHTVFRQWYKDTEPYFKDGYFGGLSYEQKPSAGKWPQSSRLLVVPPLDGYSIYYQTMTVDRQDRIFVSYSYRNEKKEYGTGEAENHYMALLMSPDHGKQWRLVTTEDFAAAIAAQAKVDATLSPAMLAGMVRDAAGKPIAGVRITAVGATATTDDTGAFTFKDVLSDEFVLSAELPGYATRTVPVSFKGGKSLDMRLQLDVAPPPEVPPAPKPAP